MRRRRSLAGQHPVSATLHSPYRTPLFALHRRTMRRHRSRAGQQAASATLHSPHCTPLFALHKRTMRRRRSRAGRSLPAAEARNSLSLRSHALRRMRIASNHRPGEQAAAPCKKKHRCRKIRHRCVRVFKSSFRVFRAAPGPQSKPSRKQRSPKVRRTTSRKTMPPARSACKR